MWKKRGCRSHFGGGVLVVLLFCAAFGSATARVEYDDKSFIINGKRRILISGSIHYPRSTPEMWPDLIQKAKEGGLDVIQTYVFWNGHEPSPGQYNFEGRYDLVRFIKVVQQAGLYVHLRIGPYVCAEWNFGGFPTWLKYIPGMEFRTDNEPFKAAMQGFVNKIVNMMNSEKLFEPLGGPIIMNQIENEYGSVEWEIGEPGKRYTAWFTKMALGLDTKIPWIMCKQENTPYPIIGTCNGFYCENFRPNNPRSPKMFTELWTGWYTEYGGPAHLRSAEDTAFAVARFIQNNGSFFNYYMYHGGTNFDRTAGRFIATSYDYDAPVDEYGLTNEPKYGHLRELHRVIKQAEPALLSSYPTVTWPGKNLEAHVFRSKYGDCALFLSNYDPQNRATVNFWNKQYDLPPWSVSILPDCKTVAFNTATVTSKGSQVKMISSGTRFSSWNSYTEDVITVDQSDKLSANVLFEQVNVTRDISDYLWYTTYVDIAYNEGFLKSGKDPTLTVMSAGHALQVFINGKLWGNAYGSLESPRLTYSASVKLNAGTNKISLLSSSVGLANVGTHYEKWNTGVLGPVTLSGLNEGTRDLTYQKWSYKVGLPGESRSLNSPSGISSVEWVQGLSLAKQQPLTWYKATFDAPAGNDPVALDMSSMGKGQIWVNGHGVGRYWTQNIARGNCNQCSYAGTYTENKCQINCGNPSQRWYHVPRSWLRPLGNLVVVFEEWGGDVSGISLVSRIRA